MTIQAFIYFLAILGIAETLYLLGKKLEKKRPVCIIGEKCNIALESKYSRIFVIPNEVLGLLFYISVVLLGVSQQKILMELTIFSGAAFSLFLVYLQWRVIKAWCFWCLMSAATVFLMAISTVLL